MRGKSQRYANANETADEAIDFGAQISDGLADMVSNMATRFKERCEIASDYYIAYHLRSISVAEFNNLLNLLKGLAFTVRSHRYCWS